MLICSTNAGSSENRSLLKELYDKYGRTVLGICYDILRSRHDSELAVQETFRFIYRTADSLCRIDSDEVLRSYIAVCAKHCAANIAERYNDGSTAHIDGMNAVNDLGVLSASELDFDEFSVDRAAAAVSKLDDSQREILFLRYCCELPVQDTAELFRVTQPEMSAKIRKNSPVANAYNNLAKEVLENERTRQNIETGFAKSCKRRCNSRRSFG